MVFAQIYVVFRPKFRPKSGIFLKKKRVFHLNLVLLGLIRPNICGFQLNLVCFSLISPVRG